MERCLSCKWHGILEHYVICEYSLHPLHGMRDCKTGLGCKYHEDNGRRRKPRAIQEDKPAGRPISKAASAGGKKRAENLRKGYVPCSLEAYQTLLEQVSRDLAAKAAGITGQNLYYSAKHGRIRREYAEAIRKRYGIDLTREEEP